MMGFTNGRGVTEPDLTQAMLAEKQTLLAQLRKVYENPPVGSITFFAGFDWLVAHWDMERNVMYLALKDIYSKVPFAFAATESDAAFYASRLESELSHFGQMLSDRIADAGLFRALTGNEMTGNKRVFVPTIEQIRDTFSLFADEGGRSNGNAIALYEGEPWYWWTSSVYQLSGQEYIRAISPRGDYIGGLAANLIAGFRPFICMKMR